MTINLRKHIQKLLWYYFTLILRYSYEHRLKTYKLLWNLFEFHRKFVNSEHFPELLEIGGRKTRGKELIDVLKKVLLILVIKYG
jgi:hypothetical protein